ncbi:hypothetical protein [Cupriavidus sp. IDO]|uniref:hypothetical protein n=1 Tax=Cupriavidus sp. IDO TaxID=1539142 RepID=UPI001269EB83|nr:hypothetical protein [Cupriavidus sp. IDO]
MIKGLAQGEVDCAALRHGSDCTISTINLTFAIRAASTGRITVEVKPVENMSTNAAQQTSPWIVGVGEVDCAVRWMEGSTQCASRQLLNVRDGT